MTASLKFVFINVILNYAQNISQWISPNSTLFRSDRFMGSAHYNNSIFIIGGYDYGYQLTEYNITNKSFIDLGINKLTDESYGRGQWYTQQNNTIFMIDPSQSTFSVYHMETRQFTSNWLSITFNTSVTDRSCLTSSQRYIFITGGLTSFPSGDYHTAVQIFNLASLQWITHVPPMQLARGMHSCIVDEERNELYNIGGYGTPGNTKTVEKISINNIQQAQWTYLDDELTWAISYAPVVLYKNNIYVIGGYVGSVTQLDIVHIISTMSGKITVSSDKLPHKIYGHTAVIVDAVIYTFGGRDETKTDINTWMYYVLEDQVTTTTAHPLLNSTQVIVDPIITIYNASIIANMSSINDKKINQTEVVKSTSAETKISVNSDLIITLIVLGIIDAVIFVCCMYYIFTKLATRSKEPNNASWMDAFKEFRFMEYAGIIIESCDIFTDYVFASDLIISNHNRILGWMSLLIAILGVILFFSKYLLLKKILGVQVKRYRKQLKETNDRDERDSIMQEIRKRKIDIDVMSLLNASIEDIPQTMIVLIVLHNVGFSYISIASISMSILSFLLKLFGILMTKFGCNDVDDDVSQHV
eukprot:50209_1